MNTDSFRSPAMQELIQPLDPCDGFSETPLSGVKLICCNEAVGRTPILYEPSLIIIAQGRKIGYLGEREIHYNAGQYLVQTLPLPFECETFASAEEPLLGLSVRIDPAVLGELVVESGAAPRKEGQDAPRPMDSVAMTGSMHEAVIRLLRALHDPQDMRIVGRQRVREVIYEALKGEQGPALRALILNQGNYSRIVRVLTQMHRDFTGELSVDDLAREANMSPSTFHQHFKQITQSSPLQYVKRLRLLKARMLLSHDDLNVNQAASETGYRSVHQFSRDYKRYFGVSPVNDRRPDSAVLQPHPSAAGVASRV
ncbi:AraC family transcriptional regulator [Marinobacter nanhaiticus D15-8W]|uniref:AraC family transcriptional regulator n=1 Tax=Marinobacter nanhaiticus D15-8W TaxID=626887 RepID=N6WZ75_9GAMM|nr:AraC family transcriptional regulator [Marinobacter nanhaiticus]ENO16447.1 AraC family transcriptional regulator [Marinobacter nanhaiticus D15-8W]BES72234.1 AraC family transcriptional regulator [Marinobacter nanhaiticus D15-8W]